MRSIIIIFFITITLSAFSQPSASEPGAVSKLTGIAYNTEWGYQLTQFDLYDDHSAFFKKGNKLIVELPSEELVGTEIQNVDLGIKLKEGLYMDRTEVPQIHYLEYLFNLLVGDSDLETYYMALPDTSVWRDYNNQLFNSLDPNKNKGDYTQLVEEYLRNNEYRYYPVVGVNYEQAKAFCNWKAQYYRDLFIETSIDFEPLVRLPTLEEYQFAMSYEYVNIQGDENLTIELPSYLSSYQFDKNSRQYIRRVLKDHDLSNYNQLNKQSDEFNQTILGLNLRTSSQEYNHLSNYGMPFYIFSLSPNNGGFYHLLGNVQEWVLDTNTFDGGKARLFGGSFMSTVDKNGQLNYIKEIYKDSSTVDIGFRCVMDLTKNSSNDQ